MSLYSTRMYATYAVLAGVRNDVGLDPISEPRGLPLDVSAETLGEYEAHGFPNERRSSASWLTLGELDAYDWSRPVVPSPTGLRPIIELNPELAHALAAMRAMGSPDDVRAVFWFS